MSEQIVEMAQTAERILVPKSRDALSGVAAFTELTGIEVPKTVWEREYVTAGGRTFRLTPGGDMPGQIAVGWGDVAICSTELVEEAGIPSLVSYRIGGSVCRYSVLALDEVADDWRVFLERTSRYKRQVRDIPASFPNFLAMIAAGRDLPVRPMKVPVSGKGEATMRGSGIRAVADRVVSGSTVRRQGGREVFLLANIYPELVVRRQDADAYRSAAV